MSAEQVQGVLRNWRPGWALVLLLLVMSGSLGFHAWLLASQVQDHQRSAVIFEQSLQASIDQFEYLPALLARDERVLARLSGDLSHDQRLNEDLEFAAWRSGADRVYVLDINGTVTAASNYREDVSFVGQNYGYRPYFADAVRSGERQFYFAKGATTGIPGLFISSPVLVDARVLGVVVVKLELTSLLASWKLARDQVLVADSNGVVILAPELRWMYQLVRPLSPHTREALVQARQFPDEQHALLYQRVTSDSPWLPANTALWTINSETWLVDHFALAETGWTLYQLVPYRQILGPASGFLAAASLMALVMYLLVIERSKKIQAVARARAAEIRRQEDLQRLIDNIYIGILVVAEDGRIRSMNAYAEDLLLAGSRAVGDEAAEDLNIMALLQLHSMGLLESYLDDRRTPNYFETRTRRGRQPVPVMCALGQIRYGGRDQYLITLVNIAKRKRAEEALIELNASLEETVALRTRELEQAQQELLQKSKAAALGKMAATIVHELSQPLAAINSSVAALETKVSRENWTGAAESAARLKPLSHKMQRVIQMLKHFSYEDSALIEDLDVGALVRQCLDVSQDLLQERGIQCVLDDTLGASGARVRMSPIKLDLALSNLIRNAVDAMEKTTQPQLQVRLQVDGRQLRITIADNGGGIDDAVMGQLFNPYVTTKQVGKGVGLGLSIAQEIVQQQQGSLTVANCGQGACFTIELPLAPTTSDAPALINAPHQPQD